MQDVASELAQIRVAIQELARSLDANTKAQLAAYDAQKRTATAVNTSSLVLGALRNEVQDLVASQLQELTELIKIRLGSGEWDGVTPQRETPTGLGAATVPAPRPIDLKRRIR